MELPDHIHLLKIGNGNLYLVEDSGEAALIDAHVGGEAEKVLEAIEEVIPLEQLRTVVLTHGHHDHIGACPLIEEKTPVEFAAHVADAWWIEEPWALFQFFSQYENTTEDAYHDFLDQVGGRGVTVSRLLRDGDTIEVGSVKLRVVHTPGHSPGSISLYDDQTKALATGDVLMPVEWSPNFIGVVADAGSHMRSLRRLSKMDVEVLLPGHGPICRGAEVEGLINHHVERFRSMEVEILRFIDEVDAATLTEIINMIVERVLNPTEREDGWVLRIVEEMTTRSFVRKLCFEGKLVQKKGPVWRRSSTG